MIERIIKYSKYMVLASAIFNFLYVIAAAIYFPLVTKAIIPSGIWFTAITIVVLVVNVIFGIAALVINKLRKF